YAHKNHQMNNYSARLLNFFLLLASIALVILFLSLSKSLMVPLCWALVLSLMVLPVSRWFEKVVSNRALGVVLCIVLVFVFFLAILFLLSSQVVALTDEVPELNEKFGRYIADFRAYVEDRWNIPYGQQPEELQKQLSEFLRSGLGLASAAVFGTVRMIATIVTIPLFMFFMLNYRHRVVGFLERHYKKRDTSQVMGTMAKITDAFQGYLSGLMLETLIVAIMVYVALLILGIPHALLFGVFMAVMNLIPFIGVFIASTVAILYVFLIKDPIIYPIVTLFVLWGIQIVENNFVKPYVVGDQLHLNPFVIILVVLFGGMMWGASGMILFIPFLAALKIILHEIEPLEPWAYLLGDD
ncbi:MAG TPA: AI-2E family transporter, partial [Saprospiraceae bacterium]|nr:AI-2E family transporter [Saprospiraceae bacterium]